MTSVVVTLSNSFANHHMHNTTHNTQHTLTPSQTLHSSSISAIGGICTNDVPCDFAGGNVSKVYFSGSGLRQALSSPLYIGVNQYVVMGDGGRWGWCKVMGGGGNMVMGRWGWVVRYGYR